MTAREAFLVAGTFLGDENKGATVDYLVRMAGARTVVRYNGGSQAGHNVVTPDGLQHCFSQFGSGTLVEGVETYLSRFMFVDPLRMVSEHNVLAGKGIHDTWDRLVISARSPVVTPFHKFAGQMRELARGEARHGSCGMGVGEAMRDFADAPRESLMVGDLSKVNIMLQKLSLLQKKKMRVAEAILREAKSDRVAECAAEIGSKDLLERCGSSYVIFSEFPIRIDDGRIWKETLKRESAMVFEGAQGLLLDRRFGFRPYVTKSDCTFVNAERLLKGYDGAVTKLGAMRAYVTRHGNGPLVTEDESLAALFPDAVNVENPWQGKFRVGWLDLVALRYAIRVLGRLDGLAMSHLDRVSGLDPIKVCVAYETRDGKTIRDLPISRKPLTDFVSSCRPIYRMFTGGDAFQKFFEFVREQLPVPLAVVSEGPTYRDRKYVGANPRIW